MSDAEMALAWYTPEAWERLVAMPEAEIEKTYEEFIHTFETVMRACVAQGRRPHKVVIDVAGIDEMVTWCHRHGLEVDDKGRATYGAVRAMGGLDAPFTDETKFSEYRPRAQRSKHLRPPF